MVELVFLERSIYQSKTSLEGAEKQKALCKFSGLGIPARCKVLDLKESQPSYVTLGSNLTLKGQPTSRKTSMPIGA